MTIGIYKIENLINGKVYIGQSVNIEERYKAHLRASQPEKYSVKEKDFSIPIHRAMAKYGVDNFKLSILKTCLKEELDEYEIYYIKYFKSMNKKYGYNISPGGQKHVGGIRENHSQAKLTEKDVKKIKKMLEENIPVKDIESSFPKISKSTISMINHGKV